MTRLLTRRQWFFSLLLYLGFALAALGIAPFIGSEPIDGRQVFEDIGSGAGSNDWHTDTKIFIEHRLPRVLLSFLVGGSLALVGSVFQVILRNPLAAPYTLGVTGGGSVGAVLAISIPGWAISIGPFSSVQLMAMLGSGLCMGLIYVMARRSEGLSMNTLLLAGVTIGILCLALMQLIRYLANPHLLVSMDRWMMGGLDIVGYRQLATIFPLLVPGVGLMFMQMGSLNHLSLGEEMALGHGVDVGAVQKASFIAGALATGSVVSLAGPIGFVGLLVPHAVRRLSGFDHRVILPGAFLAGGALLVACDTVARTIFAPTEMPVGIITAIVGGPFFIYLLLKKSKR